jgi:hypothetical protein
LTLATTNIIVRSQWLGGPDAVDCRAAQLEIHSLIGIQAGEKPSLHPASGILGIKNITGQPLVGRT